MSLRAIWLSTTCIKQDAPHKKRENKDIKNKTVEKFLSTLNMEDNVESYK